MKAEEAKAREAVLDDAVTDLSAEVLQLRDEVRRLRGDGRKLYLEERLALVRRALNEQTREFEDVLPQERREAFHAFVLSCMATLDGFGPEYGGLPRG
jgi:hypothetical protein